MNTTTVALDHEPTFDNLEDWASIWISEPDWATFEAPDADYEAIRAWEASETGERALAAQFDSYKAEVEEEHGVPFDEWDTEMTRAMLRGAGYVEEAKLVLRDAVVQAPLKDALGAHGRHGRAPGSRPTRNRGSRRCAASRGDPDDLGDEPPSRRRLLHGSRR